MKRIAWIFILAAASASGALAQDWKRALSKQRRN